MSAQQQKKKRFFEEIKCAKHTPLRLKLVSADASSARRHSLATGAWTLMQIRGQIENANPMQRKVHTDSCHLYLLASQLNRSDAAEAISSERQGGRHVRLK